MRFIYSKQILLAGLRSKTLAAPARPRKEFGLQRLFLETLCEGISFKPYEGLSSERRFLRTFDFALRDEHPNPLFLCCIFVFFLWKTSTLSWPAYSSSKRGENVKDFDSCPCAGSLLAHELSSQYANCLSSIPASSFSQTTRYLCWEERHSHGQETPYSLTTSAMERGTNKQRAEELQSRVSGRITELSPSAIRAWRLVCGIYCVRLSAALSVAPVSPLRWYGGRWRGKRNGPKWRFCHSPSQKPLAVYNSDVYGPEKQRPAQADSVKIE